MQYVIHDEFRFDLLFLSQGLKGSSTLFVVCFLIIRQHVNIEGKLVNWVLCKPYSGHQTFLLGTCGKNNFRKSRRVRESRCRMDRRSGRFSVGGPKINKQISEMPRWSVKMGKSLNIGRLSNDCFEIDKGVGGICGARIRMNLELKGHKTVYMLAKQRV
jgi:hypothetical protein